MKRSFFAVPIALAALAFATPSLADDAALRKEAEARFAEGSQLHNAGKEEEARMKFEQAYALAKAPRIVFSLARTEQLTGKSLEALRHFREFLRDPKAPPEFVTKARTFVAELERVTARLEITAPSGALVTLDKEAPQLAPTEPVDVLPGWHHLEARDGDKIVRAEVNAATGAVTPVRLDFAQGSAPSLTQAQVPPNDTQPPPDTSTPHSHSTFWTTPHIIGIGLAGGAVLGGVLGGVFLSQSASAHDEARAYQDTIPGRNPCGATQPSNVCSPYTSKIDDTNRLRTMGVVSLVAAGAFAAGAVTMFLWPAPSSEKSARFVPVVAPGMAGASWSGTF